MYTRVASSTSLSTVFHSQQIFCIFKKLGILIVELRFRKKCKKRFSASHVVREFLRSNAITHSEPIFVGKGTRHSEAFDDEKVKLTFTLSCGISQKRETGSQIYRCVPHEAQAAGTTNRHRSARHPTIVPVGRRPSYPNSHTVCESPPRARL